MKDFTETMPGLDRIKSKFLALLEVRQADIAYHSLAAWKSSDPAETQTQLRAVQNILHLIVGSAGTLGFNFLGEAARSHEESIIEFLENTDDDSAEVPDDFLNHMDSFISRCQTVMQKD